MATILIMVPSPCAVTCETFSVKPAIKSLKAPMGEKA